VKFRIEICASRKRQSEHGFNQACSSAGWSSSSYRKSTAASASSFPMAKEMGVFRLQSPISFGSCEEVTVFAPWRRYRQVPSSNKSLGASSLTSEHCQAPGLAEPFGCGCGCAALRSAPSFGGTAPGLKRCPFPNRRTCRCSSGQCQRRALGHSLAARPEQNQGAAQFPRLRSYATLSRMSISAQHANRF
jgi:hypothetical protein